MTVFLQSLENIICNLVVNPNAELDASPVAFHRIHRRTKEEHFTCFAYFREYFNVNNMALFYFFLGLNHNGSPWIILLDWFCFCIQYNYKYNPRLHRFK